MFDRSRGLWGRFAARAAIIALVAQALVFAFHAPQMPRGLGAEAAMLRDAVLCSMHSGGRVPAGAMLAFDPDGDAPQPAPSRAVPSCTLCLALATCGLGAPVVASGVPAPPSASVATRSVPRAAVASGSALPLTRNRGPPQSV